MTSDYLHAETKVPNHMYYFTNMMNQCTQLHILVAYLEWHQFTKQKKKLFCHAIYFKNLSPDDVLIANLCLTKLSALSTSPMQAMDILTKHCGKQQAIIRKFPKLEIVLFIIQR